MARNIEENISTEGQFFWGAVELEATRHDVEAAVNDGMKTEGNQGLILDTQQAHQLPNLWHVEVVLA